MMIRGSKQKRIAGEKNIFDAILTQADK